MKTKQKQEHSNSFICVTPLNKMKLIHYVDGWRAYLSEPFKATMQAA